MDHTRRSPWNGLTSAQCQQLDADLTVPHRMTMPKEQAYAEISDEYARRVAALLAANDLRGALWFTELWSHASAVARGEPLRHEVQQRRRIVAQDPAATGGRGKDPVTTGTEGRQVKEGGPPPRLAHVAHLMRPTS